MSVTDHFLGRLFLYTKALRRDVLLVLLQSVSGCISVYQVPDLVYYKLFISCKLAVIEFFLYVRWFIAQLLYGQHLHLVLSSIPILESNRTMK